MSNNDNFSKLLVHLQGMGEEAYISPQSHADYQKFITQFPAQTLETLTLDQYCVGKGSRESFCWWIERGLEKVLGRYMPGTSRGHMIYWEGNGQLYKTHDLAQLSDHDALAYVLQVHACIAQCNVQDDLAWLDDKQKLQERMGRPVLAMPGRARRLRLLVCYHPEDFIPISSPDHIKNFLDKLGYTGALPPPDKVVQLMKLLETFFQRAKEQIPRLTRSGFAKGLYSKALGLAPRDTSVAEDDTPEDSIPLNIMLSKSTTPVLNQILFGPPGTGKTYSVVTKALEIVEPQLIAQVQADTGLSLAAQRQKLKQRFDELVEQERIRFTTFHQSFSYEDFVEGIRASVDDGDDGGQPRFVIEKGIFAQLCDAALQNREQDAELGVRDGASVWKVSIGEINGASNTRDYCFAHDEMRVGWPNAGDLATEEYQNNPAFSHHNKNALWAFAKGAQIGDIVLCFASNSSISAVGVVTGDYRHDNSMPDAVRKDFVHVRPVRWLLKNISFSVKELNGNKALVQQTMYELHRITWPRLQEALQAKGFELSSRPTQAANASLPYVLVIDEINRGNVSRIFGELITLIEPSKRAGASEALSITLPYSSSLSPCPVMFTSLAR
ncbi:hypothetical protein [Neopusillimonas aromaticivorans]|uniref:hypothetical protein n=1 Tax=Neopusillimonas aromaticivorans TaxID=2979868 RepID=UPI00259875E2|nr:hypothetical protein [Neopusillimonas aromaticivorans]WJJ93351.1 hypothetical protein N7E01_15365 [Neopusillimonas aromaticivorans]